MMREAKTTLTKRLDISLGGFRVRLESFYAQILLSLTSSDACYDPFIDEVHPQNLPDLHLRLEPIATYSQWLTYLPSGQPNPDYILPEGALYYQRLDDGSEIFASVDLDKHIFYRMLKVDAGSKSGQLVYNTHYHTLPLDPAILFSYPLDRVLIANLLIPAQGILLHASAIGTPQGALLFTGPSGAGKTTLCRLSQQFSDCTQFCDERIVVRSDPSSYTGYRAYGTPWPGEGNIYNRLDGPLAAIFMIRHADPNQIKPVQGAGAVGRLFNETFPVSWNRTGQNQILEYIANLLEQLPSYEFGFVPTIDAITYARRYLIAKV